jgi:tetratricopeptide (TPR) repeat protein
MRQTVTDIVNQGRAHHQAGRLQQAEACYRQALASDPAQMDALQLLGVIAAQVGKHDLAVQWISKAVAARPNVAAFHNNLGTAYRGAGDNQRAIDCYRKSIQLDPALADGFSNLVKTLIDQRQLDEAVAAYAEAVERGHQTLPMLEQIIAALEAESRFDQAIALVCAALEKQPKDAAMLTLLGNVLHASGRLHEALRCYEQVLEIDPTVPQSHWNRALMLLTLGEYPEGWKEYEWRWKCANFPYNRQQFPQPVWDGSDLGGKTILLDGEGGFGDIIQLVRYARLLADRGLRVILGCPPELKELLQTVAGVHQILTKGDALPAFDVQVPMFSCPLRFGTTLETIPNAGPYISADPDRAGRIAGRIRARENVRHVGLVWCGRSMPYPNRSCPLSACAPLFGVPNIQIHSLQRDEGRAELAAAASTWNVIDHGDAMKDFADTAAIISNLDLVITIDSAAAHLAGAMGKPVWVMLPYSADWRWMNDRDDCPWYPMMKLFRQSSVGDWAGVTQRVAAALAAWR